jgi:hypothetical protein
VVVNNAGILRDRFFFNMSVEEWRAVIDVHLNGSFYVSRAAATHFKTQQSGCYVHMTSTSGLVGNLGQANYSARQARHRRPVQVDRARHGEVQRALELHLAVRLEPHDRLDPDRDRGPEGARREAEVHGNLQDRAAGGFLASDERRTSRADLRGARERDLPHVAEPAAALGAPLRRVDAGNDRRARHPSLRDTSTAWTARRTCSRGTRFEARAAERLDRPAGEEALRRESRSRAAPDSDVDTLRNGRATSTASYAQQAARRSVRSRAARARRGGARHRHRPRAGGGRTRTA